MDRETELAIIRRAFAKQVTAAVGVTDQRVEDAFAAVRREDFLGPGPWQILRWGQAYRPTPNADPVYLYTDDLVGIVPERMLNNGQPQLHAALIAAAAPQEGEHVVHVGAGTGYYTAILAQLAGRTGRVTAIELDPGLAARAAANFEGYDNVRIIEGDGVTAPFDMAAIIYVNAGASRPADAWLDRLEDGGRLILPLTTDSAFSQKTSWNPADLAMRGAVFRIERRGEDFLARAVSSVAIFPCHGARDEASAKALEAAFEKGDWQKVTRLYRHTNLPVEHCWVQAPGWSLAYDDAASASTRASGQVSTASSAS